MVTEGGKSMGDVTDIPSHVKNSQALMLFMTEGVYDRYWIMQEITTALKSSIDIVLMRETDHRHGALSLRELTEQCPSELQVRLFTNPVIDWHRDLHFKTVSILQLCQRILRQDDVGQWGRKIPELSIPKTITEIKFSDPETSGSCTYHCYCSDSTFHSYLERSLVDENKVAVRISSADHNVGDDERRNLISNSHIYLALLSPERMQDHSLHADIKFALMKKKAVIVLHDGGLATADFDGIVKFCPPELVELGLFSNLALEWHSEKDAREVSVKLLWHKINSLCNISLDQSQLVMQSQLKINPFWATLANFVQGACRAGKDRGTLREPGHAQFNVHGPKLGEAKRATKSQVVPQREDTATKLKEGPPVTQDHQTERKNSTAMLIEQGLDELEK
jgi:hypothetical protein